MKKHLQATEYIDCKHPDIQDICQLLTQNCSSASERASRIFYYVRDNCHYNMYDISQNLKDYRASAILQTGHGWCLSKAVLLAALGRAAGLPSRLALAAIRNYRLPPEVEQYLGFNLFFPHAYNQFYLDDNWLSCAATFDKVICEKADLPVVEFNGKENALFSPTDNQGRAYIDYAEFLGYYDDLPWKVIKENISRFYGESYSLWFPMLDDLPQT
jgi:transglutaminase-like putative cysteine protease